MRIAIACGFVLSLAATSRGQTQFRADLDAASVVPPASSSAGAFASVVLNADDTVTYSVRSWLVSGTAASINTGAVGVNGPVLFTLSGGPSEWSGTTTALGAADKANLRASGLYVEIDTAANPGGELRGQIVPRPMLFGAHLTADQETTGSTSSAIGDATFIVNSDGTITYSVTTTGLSATAAHIHLGAFGVAGKVLFPLVGGPTDYAGTTIAMTSDQFDTIQADGFYVNVHTAANPLGEIRGQIVPTEIPYGIGLASSVGMATLHAGGAAMRGGTISIDIAGAVPSGSGLLLISLGEGSSALKTVPYLLGAPLLIIPLPLDPAGAISLPGSIPDLSGSLDVYFQFFGFDKGGPNGDLYATNGLLVPVFDY